MSRRRETMTPDYFEALYAADPDPWRFATSDYERDKYAATLAALPRAHYGRALDVGCSIGVLTMQLAPRCEALLAMDPSATALAQARERALAAGAENVRFLRGAAPGDWPEGRFDLILLSEVAYYLCADDLEALIGRVADALAPQGDVILAHWTGETDYPLTGDEAAGRLLEGLSARGAARPDPQRSARFPRWRLDVLRGG